MPKPVAHLERVQELSSLDYNLKRDSIFNLVVQKDVSIVRAPLQSPGTSQYVQITAELDTRAFVESNYPEITKTYHYVEAVNIAHKYQKLEALGRHATCFANSFSQHKSLLEEHNCFNFDQFYRTELKNHYQNHGGRENWKNRPQLNF
uniref:Uncharacterized protein n=1 Tax=Rhipiliopsis peltata TaxID=2320810 RepID=A0A386B1E8_9CHLO|nr:hypothetical protein [Rhipiliopsis peltata]AYC65493.1 hypothetical protein [Rhipiliopsis peltata]